MFFLTAIDESWLGPGNEARGTPVQLNTTKYTGKYHKSGILLSLCWHTHQWQCTMLYLIMVLHMHATMYIPADGGIAGGEVVGGGVVGGGVVSGGIVDGGVAGGGIVGGRVVGSGVVGGVVGGGVVGGGIADGGVVAVRGEKERESNNAGWFTSIMSSSLHRKEEI